MKNIVFESATTILELIKTKQVTIEFVTISFLNHIEKYNPKINAVIELRDKSDIISEAKEKDRLLQSGLAKGSLFGLPMTIKDSFWVKGLKNSNGDPLYRNAIATEDAFVVQAIKKEGAIILGKTNVPLYCIDWQTTNFWNGRTNNPYDLSRTVGGSSGGSAAAVAAGFSALEIGADAGGSIRVPAHFNGICGLRPTENIVSNYGHIQHKNKPLGNRNIVTPGPLAKNVEDLILLMNVLCKDSNKLNFNRSTTDFSIENLKIAYTETINNVEVDQEYLEIFRDFLSVLKDRFGDLIEDAPHYDEKEAYLEYNKVIGFEIGVNNMRIPFMSFFLYVFILLKYRDHNWAKGMSSGYRAPNYTYAKAIDCKNEITKVYSSFFEKYDIWITPVCAMEAFKHQLSGKEFIINEKKVAYTKALATFNFTTAFSGHPIVVIPIGKKQNGMPVGIQIHSKRHSDRELLEIAKCFEQFAYKYEKPIL
ncbi:MAG: amidase [Limnohabitans sp.]|nr:amidase [Limnohabitans sp.]